MRVEVHGKRLDEFRAPTMEVRLAPLSTIICPRDNIEWAIFINYPSWRKCTILLERLSAAWTEKLLNEVMHKPKEYRGPIQKRRVKIMIR